MTSCGQSPVCPDPVLGCHDDLYNNFRRTAVSTEKGYGAPTIRAALGSGGCVDLDDGLAGPALLRGFEGGFGSSEGQYACDDGP